MTIQLVRLNHLSYFYCRDFVVQEMDTNEIRHITQMAYLSWPDHGVPESNEEFVDFVEKVRTCRQGYSLCPTVVHCSAGNVFWFLFCKKFSYFNKQLIVITI